MLAELKFTLQLLGPMRHRENQMVYLSRDHRFPNNLQLKPSGYKSWVASCFCDIFEVELKYRLILKCFVQGEQWFMYTVYKRINESDYKPHGTGFEELCQALGRLVEEAKHVQ